MCMIMSGRFWPILTMLDDGHNHRMISWCWRWGGWLKWCNFCVNHVYYSCKPNSRTVLINIAELLMLQSCIKGILVTIFLFYQKLFFFSLMNCYYNFQTKSLKHHRKIAVMLVVLLNCSRNDFFLFL